VILQSSYEPCGTETMISDVTTDTSVLIKGLVTPRRKVNDALFNESVRLHKNALIILEKIENGEYHNHIPVLAIIETACVVSRLTNDPESPSLAVSFVSNNSKLYDTTILLEKSIEIGIKQKQVDSMLFLWPAPR